MVVDILEIQIDWGKAESFSSSDPTEKALYIFRVRKDHSVVNFKIYICNIQC